MFLLYLYLSISEFAFQGTQEEWQFIFFIGSGVFVCGILGYLIFGRAEEQEWAKVKHKNTVLETQVELVTK